MYSDVAKHVVLYTSLHAHWLPVLQFQPCRAAITGHGLELLTELFVQLSLCLFLLGDLCSAAFQIVFVRILMLLAKGVSNTLFGRVTVFSVAVV